MSNFTAYSFLENSIGIIKIFSDNGFSTTTFEKYRVFDEVFTGHDLYTLDYNGSGVLDSSGKVLTIEIPDPPQNVRIVLGDFNKIFTFFERDYPLQYSLVFSNSFKIGAPSDDYGLAEYKNLFRDSKGFVLFSNLPEHKFNESTYKGVLSVGKEVVGYTFGALFYRAYSNASDQSYGFGGLVFPRVFWVNKPTQPVSLKLSIQVSDGVFSEEVYYDGNNFTEFFEEPYNVLPDHVFEVNNRRFKILLSMGWFF